MMNEKDYQAIAEILGRHEKKEKIVVYLCEYFQKDNPKFDKDEFLRAIEDTSERNKEVWKGLGVVDGP